MKPDTIQRDQLNKLTDLPNVGARIAAVLGEIGIDRPGDLVGRDGFELYQTLCETAGQRFDPCVLDTFIAITRFMDGDPAQPWWNYTAERKKRYPNV